VDNVKLTAKQIMKAIAPFATGRGTTGTVVWPSSVVLTQLMQSAPQLRRRLAGARVLELGAGMGMVGMAAAMLGANRLVLTDRGDPLYQNVKIKGPACECNRCSRVVCMMTRKTNQKICAGATVCRYRRFPVH
jgi:ribosomal protein L11 methylase PrmA